MSAVSSFKEMFKKNDHSVPVAKFAEIDQSLKLPMLCFFSAAIFWLLVGTVFALLASFALHSPNLLPNWEWLTFGRIRSAHLNAVAFGWGNNAVFAVFSWIMLRLCQIKARQPIILLMAFFFWNLCIAIGLTAILAGQITSVEWLEMPRYITPLIAVSYLLVGIWAMISFRFRQSEHVYVSQWYILAALFWFPWLYIAVQTMVIWFPARGTVQSITNWWFAHNALGLWYTPISVATIYYLIPKVLGKPIHSYYLSVVGFWSLALFYNWAGVHHLVGGPIPVWLQSVGIVASVMMVIPVVVTGFNHHFTVVGSFKHVWASPTLRFTVFGAMNYTLSSLIGSTMSLREVSEVTHFTHAVVSHAHHGAYGFFTMVMFGAMYYSLPRLLKREWPSAPLIRMHFWTCAIGITIYVVGLTIGGWIQGLEMNNSDIPFIDTVINTIPYLMSRSVAGCFLAIGHITFAVHFVMMLLNKQKQEGPTLIAELQTQAK